MLGACGQERAEPRPLSGETLGKSSQELRAESYDYVGSSTMGAKQLALTFDDGPGTRTSELSTYLKNENIRAVFFVNGACIEPTSLPNDSCGAPTANAKTILAQLAADGHLVANHTTTHRNITTIPTNQRVQELSETDALIVAHGKTPWNRSLFRAPFGAWASSVHTTLSASTMRHYVGPIYWDIGGYSDRYPNAAADWACFQGDLKQGSVLVHSAPGDPLPDGYATTRECGDAYRAEIDAVRSGIVLMHDPASGSTGSTVDMVKYLVPLLKADGYTFVRADEVPRIAADFPACAGTGCVTCSGAAANQCTSCAAGRYLSGGTCLACSTCAAGTYQSAACTATTDTVCPACDASCTTCSGAGTAACTSCAPDRYLAGGSCLACSTCAAGSYPSAACTATTNTVCAACDASCTTCSGAGTAACTSCPAGSYLSGGSCLACSSCAAGTYPSAACTATTNTVCSACHASCSVCSGPDASQCGACPTGFYLDNGTCQACTVCPAGSRTATACTPNANTVCAPCAAGTASSVPGSETCTACAPGTYASDPGAATCKSCGSCDDGDPCTTDTCSPTTGCTHAPIAGCGGSSGSSGTSGSPGGPLDGGTSSGASPDDDQSGCQVGRTSRTPSRPWAALGAIGALGLALVRRRRGRESIM
ncbi:MAG: hypothetical protein BGO98_40455 [Myxococcales bacterium 68-20]|nr:MAG: hypothetical protein BGO98_40455 [Myxococcales bacterium 68-20]